MFDTEYTEPIYEQYLYDPIARQWNKYMDGKQIKSVRFNRNGRMYQLLPDGCVYNDVGAKLLCNVKDFEVLLNGKFIIVPENNINSIVNYANGEYDVDLSTNVLYQAYNDYRALALQLEKPIFVLPNGTIQGPEGNYNGICAIDLTVGIDSQIWAL